MGSGSASPSRSWRRWNLAHAEVFGKTFGRLDGIAKDGERRLAGGRGRWAENRIETLIHRDLGKFLTGAPVPGGEVLRRYAQRLLYRRIRQVQHKDLERHATDASSGLARIYTARALAEFGPSSAL